MKKYIKAFFKEIAPVIAGILIALWVNNWNEIRKDIKYVETVYSRIEKELRTTEKSIEEIIPKQLRFLDTLNYYMKNDNVSLVDIIIKTDGVYAPTTKLNSWKSMSNSKIELLDYDKMILLSEIEETDKGIRYRERNTNDFIMANANDTSITKKELLKFFIKDLISASKFLQGEIKEVINE